MKNIFAPIAGLGVQPTPQPTQPLGLTGGTSIGVQPVSTNYTNTPDPNVKIGKHGLRITKDDFENANKNGYAWKNLDAYADWLGGWAKKLPVVKAEHPYYRTYPSGQISAGDMALLEARDDPKVNAILQRNIAGKNEIPQYGENDSDYLKAIIKGSKPASK